jgi:hypothetical protein
VRIFCRAGLRGNRYAFAGEDDMLAMVLVDLRAPLRPAHRAGTHPLRNRIVGDTLMEKYVSKSQHWG